MCIRDRCLQAVEVPYVHNRVLFVERSGELRLLARLSTIEMCIRDSVLLVWGRGEKHETNFTDKISIRWIDLFPDVFGSSTSYYDLYSDLSDILKESHRCV